MRHSPLPSQRNKGLINLSSPRLWRSSHDVEPWKDISLDSLGEKNVQRARCAWIWLLLQRGGATKHFMYDVFVRRTWLLKGYKSDWFEPHIIDQLNVLSDEWANQLSQQNQSWKCSYNGFNREVLPGVTSKSDPPPFKRNNIKDGLGAPHKARILGAAVSF